MYTLAIDTTAAACLIALFKDEKCVEKYAQEMDFGQAEVLIPEIGHLLQKNRLTMSDLSLLVVCVGPGSFTGVRSSIACARAFAIALPALNITGVSAFDAYVTSLDMSELSEYNAVIIETKRDDFYFQLFNGKLEKLCEPQALNYEEIINILKGHTITLIGDGVERFLDKPSGLVLHSVKLESSIKIADLAMCALKKYEQKKLNYPKPLYLRAPDVCVKA
jgi:tRNA threonylcarbamoyladenosine biosynthesis protein TsaB